MSSVIAVAGGTGGLGRAIVDALNANTKSTVLVLSRQSSAEKEKEIGAKIIAVDYDDPTSLTAILEKNNIDTVISTMAVMTTSAPELALLKAAEGSSVTKRFIPSNWGIPYNAELASVFPPAKLKLEIKTALEATSLDYTIVHNGFFADYFAPQVPTYLNLFTFWVDALNNTAAIPGDGETPVVFSHTWDVAKFIAAYVEKPQWDRAAFIIGDKVTFNELVRFLEEAKGVKFTVSHDKAEDLMAGKATELLSYQHYYRFMPKEALLGMVASMGWMLNGGHFNLPLEGSLTQEFSSLKPRTMQELIAQSYKN